MTAFESAFKHTVGLEGRYSDHPSDSGGKTMFGITERVARAWGYNGDMRNLPLSTAQAIYKKNYWDKMKLDGIAGSMPRLAGELFDACVNVGTTHPASWLQAALNGLNNRAQAYPDIAVDGQIGPATMRSIGALVAMRGAANAERALGRLCDSQQAVYYLELTQRREKDEAFLYGWIMNRVGGW